ncbi:MAG TPA: GatB/YqeY domain-containing protein [Gammaproteobacteria bacterium]|nr:GatB/YqeY domain-containing protein [Gammaproteobacteria bacterium]
MTTSVIKQKIQEDMKNAMRNQEKDRLSTIRLILAAIKQREVDERIELGDEQVLTVLDKMLKQRRESVTQYEMGKRLDLAQKETAEIEVIQTYLPAQLGADEIDALIRATIQETGASTARDMGKVMSLLKPKIQGRADVAAVSNKVKEHLSG